MIMCVLLCYPVSIHMSQLQATVHPISSFLSLPLFYCIARSVLIREALIQYLLK